MYFEDKANRIYKALDKGHEKSRSPEWFPGFVSEQQEGTALLWSGGKVAGEFGFKFKKLIGPPVGGVQ